MPAVFPARADAPAFRRAAPPARPLPLLVATGGRG